MLQLASKFSKLSTSASSFFGISRMIPAQVQSLYTAPPLNFQLTQNNFGGVTKKKKRQDPSRFYNFHNFSQR